VNAPAGILHEIPADTSNLIDVLCQTTGKNVRKGNAGAVPIGLIGIIQVVITGCRYKRVV